MDAFFGITLSAIILYTWWRSETRMIDPKELQRNTVKARWDRKRIKTERLRQEQKLAQKVAQENQKRRDAELISVIIPTINNDK